MRVLDGIWKGRTIDTQGDFRPMTEMVKQALFHVLGDLSGLRVLDLFAGTGQLGIEALSRGAAQAVFVDSDSRNAAAIRKTIEKWSDPPATPRVLTQDAVRFLSSTQLAFDLIIADPPYEKGFVRPCIHAVAASATLLAPGGRFVLRHTKHEPLDETHPAGLTPEFTRKYGDDLLHIWRKSD